MAAINIGGIMDKALEEEKAHLVHTEKVIVKEIAKEEINLQEIPKRHNKVLQGDSFLVESLMTIAATRLRKLEEATKNPYFGRIDFLSDGETETVKIYVGKNTISDEKNEQVTTDWRSPICSLYYDGDVGRVSYEVPRGKESGELKLKRQIIIKEGEIINVTDTNIVNNDELLQPYLNVNADNRIKTIIASIQKEQNSIIRKPISQNIIVQGVAGSGKTSVALHRIAYVVYNLGDNITSRQILSLGPNKYFLDYVSSVLPELETEPVDQKTYLELLNYLLNSKYTLENGETKSETVKRIQAFKTSLVYQRLIKEFMDDYFSQDVVENGIMIDGEEVYSRETIHKYLFLKSKNVPNYDFACECILKHWKENMHDIYDRLNQKYRTVYISLPKGDSIREEAVAKSTELYNLVKNNGTKIIKDYFKKIALKPIDIYDRFINSLDKRELPLSQEEITTLKEMTTSTIKKRKVSFEDMPALLYINYLLHGPNNQYKHIVIDEAQDYGPFHFSVLTKVYPNSTFSIYGDIGQSIYYHRAINSWEELSEEVFTGNCSILYLNKSYRTTMEITNNANKILNTMNLPVANPVIRHGEDIRCLDMATELEYKITRINELISKGYKTIALMCKTDKEANDMFKKLSNHGINATLITTKTERYDGGVFIVTSELAKGLEFDAVIINDASSKVYDINSLTDMHLLYVACTRALHELDILYDKEICQVFGNIEKQKLRNRR